MKHTISLILVFILVFQAYSQADTAGVYRVNRWGCIGVVVGAEALNYWGTQQIIGKGSIPNEKIANISKSNVNSFDRFALNQKLTNWRKYHEQSNILLAGALVLPFSLFFDKDIRAQAIDVTLVYLKTALFTNLVYSVGPNYFIDRYRPIVYYTDATISDRTKSTNRSSFFSGHTSAATSAFFFTAKAYSDFHPELGNKKWWLYGGATVLSGYMGYLRYKALKHFPTDILAGMVVGAAGGVLIPHWHKKRQERFSIGFLYEQDVKQFSLVHRF